MDKINELLNEATKIDKEVNGEECKHLMNPETCISCIDEEHNRFEMHCKDDLYFFCPLCEEYHEKTKTTKGEYKTIWWCQIPIRDQEAMIR